MNFRFRMFFTATLLAGLATLCSAQTATVLTNDDGLLHSYVSFFTAGGSTGAPTLTFATDVNTQGQGIGGGYFASARVITLPDPSTQCAYASNAGTANISGINMVTKQTTGLFAGSDTDAGDALGIGLAMNTNYLYAAYTASNNLATFAVQAGCQLSFLGDTPAVGLNGGAVAGMALHGSMMIVAYADGSIESFNISNGLPVSNGDALTTTAYNNALSNFPEGVDITQDGHYAIFGDSSIVTTIEVSDISSGRLTQTKQYTISGGQASAVKPPSAVSGGANSGALRLSPDQSMIFIGNNDGGSVSAAFFDKTTGKVSGGCKSLSLAGFYNPWAFVGSVATRDTTGTGGVLYVAEYGFSGSYIGVVKITSNGSNCGLTESSASEVPDLLSDGLLSIYVFPPRPF